MSIVSFLIKVQDAASGPLGKISSSSGTAKTALDKLTESNKELKAMVGGSAVSINDLNTRIENLRKQRNLLPATSETQIRAINSEIKKLSNEMEHMNTMNGSKLKSWWKEAYEELPSLAKNPLIQAGAFLVTSFNEGLKNSKDKLDFTQLVGKKAGTQVYEGAKAMKNYYGDGAKSGAMSLLESGMDSGNVSDTMNRLGKVASGDAGKFGGLTSAFASLQREGKLTESVLEQMNDNGFKPLTLLQERFGKSTAYWQLRLADGKISINDVNKALQGATDKGGLFADSLDKIDNSPMGIWERLTSAGTEFASTFGDLIIPAVMPFFRLFNWLLDKAIAGMTWLKTKIEDNQPAIEGLVAVLLGAATAWSVYQAGVRLAWLWQSRDMVQTAILTTLKGAQAGIVATLTAAWTGLNAAMMANPIGFVIAAVVGLVGGIGILAWKFEGVRKVVYGVWETFKEVFTSIGNLFKKIFAPIGEGIAAIEKRDWAGLAKAAGKMMLNLSPAGLVKNAVEFTKDGGFKNIGGAYQKGADKASAEFAAKKNGHKENSKTDDLLEEYLKKNDASGDAEKTQEQINAVSGGGSKVYNVNIGAMVENLVQHVSGGQEAAQDIRAVLEVEMARVFQSLR